VFANLHHALVECRHFWSQHHPDKEFLLWTDQICIYQPDSAERAHQVSFMGDIYRAAKQTLICLSTKHCDARGFEWIQEVLTLPTRGPFNVSDNAFVSGWLGFLDVVTTPWWTRAWVFQEFILSQRPIFLYGHASMAWDNFDVSLEKVFGYLRLAYFSRSYDEIEVELSPRDLEIKYLFQRSDKAQEQVNRFLTRKDEFTSVRTHRVLVNKRGTEAVYEHFRPTSDLGSLLFNANCFRATDERDKIYAFLGLTDIPHGIIPSYSLDCQVDKLCLAITRKIIELEKSIEVLKYTWSARRIKVLGYAPFARHSCAQSWVVPWTRLDCQKIQGLITIPDKFLPKNWLAEPSITKAFFSPRISLNVWGLRLKNGELTYSPEHPKDETWILYGLKVPVFLYPISSGYFRLKGPAEFIITRVPYRQYVDSMPKVFQEVEDGILKRRRISIV
jgi:hypothetical protein